MRKLLVATHGRFAEGITEALEFILGKCPLVQALSAYTTADYDIRNEVEKIVAELENGDELIVAADVFGGSVANTFSEYLNHPGIHVLCGVNFPMLVELVSLMDTEEDTDKLLYAAANAAREGIVYLNEVIGERINDEEEEF